MGKKTSVWLRDGLAKAVEASDLTTSQLIELGVSVTTQSLRLREDRGDFWQEWYCEVPPRDSRFVVPPGGDHWSDDPETGMPLRKIYVAIPHPA